jgi:hypothetical protein
MKAIGSLFKTVLPKLHFNDSREPYRFRITLNRFSSHSQALLGDELIIGSSASVNKVDRLLWNIEQKQTSGNSNPGGAQDGDKNNHKLKYHLK